MRYNIKHYKGARIIHLDRDADAVETTYKHAMAGIRKGLCFFGLPPEFPLINIFIAPRRTEYDKLVSHLTKVPTSKGRLGQPQGHDLYIISPKAWATDVHPDYLASDGGYDKKIYRQFIEHETVHMLEEYSSPKDAMELRPQWWCEGLAVYATGQWKDRLTRCALKEALAARKFPDIAGMKGSDAYTWGWSLVRFIEKRFGNDALKKIILGSCEEDILGFLKLNKTKFEAEWRRAMPALAREAIKN
jgi:hypothetical protein